MRGLLSIKVHCSDGVGVENSFVCVVEVDKGLPRSLVQLVGPDALHVAQAVVNEGINGGNIPEYAQHDFRGQSNRWLALVFAFQGVTYLSFQVHQQIKIFSGVVVHVQRPHARVGIYDDFDQWNVLSGTALQQHGFSPVHAPTGEVRGQMQARFLQVRGLEQGGQVALLVKIAEVIEAVIEGRFSADGSFLVVLRLTLKKFVEKLFNLLVAELWHRTF